MTTLSSWRMFIVKAQASSSHHEIHHHIMRKVFTNIEITKIKTFFLWKRKNFSDESTRHRGLFQEKIGSPAFQSQFSGGRRSRKLCRTAAPSTSHPPRIGAALAESRSPPLSWSVSRLQYDNVSSGTKSFKSYSLPGRHKWNFEWEKKKIVLFIVNVEDWKVI